MTPSKKNTNFIQVRFTKKLAEVSKSLGSSNYLLQKMYSFTVNILLGFLLAVVFSSCVPSKNLKPNEYLLYKQSISGNKRISTEKLEAFYRQKPNRKLMYLPFSPYIYAYYRGLRYFKKQKPKYEKRLLAIEEKYEPKIAALTDTVKNHSKRKQNLEKRLKQKRKKLNYKIENGNFMMTTVGEAPAILDEEDMEESRSQMQLFLNKKGFFGAKVKVKTDSVKKRVSVKYQVEEGTPHRIDKITYQIADEEVKE